MTDIVERLREENLDHLDRIDLCDSAADEIESLRQQLADANESMTVVYMSGFHDGQKKSNNQCFSAGDMAECQAREKVLRYALEKVISQYGANIQDTVEVKELIAQNALALPPDSTSLDALKHQWQREALLEAASRVDKESSVYDFCGDKLRRMAEELK
jgi:UDP-2,3-diacylglucosamine pyrophosphatase LpxH